MQPSPGPKEGPIPVPFLTVFPSVMLPLFLAMVDQTIVATALPAIAVELGGVERIGWVVVSYLVASAISAPVSGRIADALGRRRMLVAALAISMLGSLICLVATNFPMLLAGRAVQGVGGGGMISIAMALIGQSVPPRERARFQGYVAAVAMTASMIGPVMGGILTQYLGWRSIFLLPLPFGMLAAFLAFRLPPRRVPRERFVFDLPGLLLFAGLVIAILALVDQLRDPASLSAVLTILLLSAATLLTILFIAREKRASTPIMPLHLLRNPSIWRSDVLTICHGAVVVSLITYMPIYLRAVRDASAAEIGVLMIPLTIGIGIGSIITGQIVSRTGRTTIMPSLGLFGVMTMMVVLAFLAPGLETLALMGYLGVSSLFLGTVMNVVHVTVTSEAGPRLLGTASGGVTLSRSLGAAVGTSIVGAVLFATVVAPGFVSPADFQELLQAPTDGRAPLPASREALDQGFRYVFATVAVFAGLGMSMALTIPKRVV